MTFEAQGSPCSLLPIWSSSRSAHGSVLIRFPSCH
jgi:hypothetical protein